MPEIPSKLYKYRSLAKGVALTYTRQAIADRELYLASPSQINDPFEFRFEATAEGTHQQWTQRLAANFKRNAPEKSDLDHILDACALMATHDPAELS